MSGIVKNRTTRECPHCGGTAHRKALQKLKTEPKPYRRMYCADGCGHFHYRDPDTDEVVSVGQGPRIPKFHQQQAPTLVPVPFHIDLFGEIAGELGISTDELAFTAKSDTGRPRVIVNCFSDEDVARLSCDKDREAVRYLQRSLLVIQAAIKTYKDRM